MKTLGLGPALTPQFNISDPPPGVAQSDQLATVHLNRIIERPPPAPISHRSNLPTAHRAIKIGGAAISRWSAPNRAGTQVEHLTIPLGWSRRS
jgi:hypothetical protein